MVDKEKTFRDVRAVDSDEDILKEDFASIRMRAVINCPLIFWWIAKKNRNRSIIFYGAVSLHGVRDI